MDLPLTSLAKIAIAMRYARSGILCEANRVPDVREKSLWQALHCQRSAPLRRLAYTFVAPQRGQYACPWLSAQRSRMKTRSASSSDMRATDASVSVLAAGDKRECWGICLIRCFAVIYDGYCDWRQQISVIYNGFSLFMTGGDMALTDREKEWAGKAS